MPYEDEPDHFVKVTFEPVSEEELELLLQEDEQLNDLFANSAVDYDGYERGEQDFVMYFYGKNADDIASLIIPELSKLPFSNRAVLLKRYGRAGAKENTLRLNPKKEN